MSRGFPDEPGSREPGLEHLIKALTADGYPHELAGRDAALAAFRANSRPRPGRAAVRMSRSFRLGLPARLGAVAAALVAALAGVTAAAYAKALPAPMQHIAYSVLGPVGVPDSQPSAPAPGSRQRPTPPAASGAVSSPSVHGTTPSPAATAACPCPAGTASPPASGSVLTITVARAQLPANGYDAFSGKLTDRGRPESGVRLQLLDQAAGTTGWQDAGSAVTGKRGMVRLGIPHVTQNAIFRLTGPDGLASPEIAVTVIPRVQFWRGTAARAGIDRLVAQARFGDVGDTVVLQELSGGTWQNVTSKELNAAHRASFELPTATAAGQYYRVMLQATRTHGASVSEPVFVPRLRTATGATAIESHRMPPGPVGTDSDVPAGGADAS